ncbi:MAG: GH39 family glycosyl hydrolase [Candidatus Aminicenantales bacterium]
MKKIILFFLFLVFSSFPSAISQHPSALLSEDQKREPPKKRPREIPEAQKVLNPEDYAPVYIPVDELTISIGKKEGFIRPLLGVNAGPAPSGEKGNADLSEQYQLFGIRAVRTHDFYGPFDLSQIYPDINAPPENPASYDFSASDQVYQKIIQAGCTVYLRVGDSFNNVRIPRNPKERNHLSQAAVEVVKHYQEMARQSKALPIKYIEIWNEPDLNRFWPAGMQDFQEFYIETFIALKKEFPEIKIGGPGLAVLSSKMPAAKQKAARFLERLKENSISPDFLSFHLYSNNPNKFFDVVRYYRSLLERTGIRKSELHITEWNTERKPADASLITGEKAASYFTACWIALQRAEVDQSFIYRGTDTSPNYDLFYGIFRADGRPKPSALAFRLWSQFSTYPKKINLCTGIPVIDSEPRPETKPSPLWLLGAEKEKGETAVLLANISSQEYKIALDESFLFRTLKLSEIKSANPEIREYRWGERKIIAPAHSVLLIELLN